MVYVCITAVALLNRSESRGESRMGMVTKGVYQEHALTAVQHSYAALAKSVLVCR